VSSSAAATGGAGANSRVGATGSAGDGTAPGEAETGDAGGDAAGDAAGAGAGLSVSAGGETDAGWSSAGAAARRG
jgi:hypothetical protein